MRNHACSLIDCAVCKAQNCDHVEAYADLCVKCNPLNETKLNAKVIKEEEKAYELKRESQLLDSLTESHKKQFQIARKKNADYSRGDDEYRNFETCNRILPWITTEEGIIIRMLDKITRLGNLAHYGNSYVTDESFEDTCDDIANYANILKAYRQHKRIYEIKKEENVLPTTSLA